VALEGTLLALLASDSASLLPLCSPPACRRQFCGTGILPVKEQWPNGHGKVLRRAPAPALLQGQDRHATRAGSELPAAKSGSELPHSRAPFPKTRFLPVGNLANSFRHFGRMGPKTVRFRLTLRRPVITLIHVDYYKTPAWPTAW